MSKKFWEGCVLLLVLGIWLCVLINGWVLSEYKYLRRWGSAFGM